MPAPLKLALILGSARHRRFCDRVAGWTRRRLAAHGGFEVDVIDPAELPLSVRDQPLPRAAWGHLEERLAAADAFLIVTPEYNHGYTAALKALLDTVHDAWQAKPVGFVAYGGASGGLRAVEQLRLVFASLHAVTLGDTVSFAHAWERFGPGGALYAPLREDHRLALLLERLAWWARALRTARRAEPYESVGRDTATSV
ncbi:MULTISPECIES: NAD(P)H-dependent oxidoreductase [unclassified Modicisalibacter]|uniref:NADPH-dependent FMN reductase n=1 Tax=unclassified Modicisalibacter TaxID=2679913 RepID=UPI001CCB8630|nr:MULTISPECIES: NAD(P)H-dependent oxidoreductase [unclassified Modicisalibacter]MBZ9558442.1 NAD(P)H-dependent oxidoreductase [Modicisalibacter sp. R2A 31.J]MBZ9575666.1 NAD(P)H-dependent oxidoreductase [Modicisalibacter sp. MOD 31.J]